MKHLTIVIGLVLSLGATTAALAEINPVEARLLSSLTEQGYTILEDGYTWLGRLRIVAENGTLHREIVVNPGTGEVLRDYAVRIDDLGAGAATGFADNAGHAGQGGSGATAALAGTVATGGAATGVLAVLPGSSATDSATTDSAATDAAPDTQATDPGVLTPALEN
jgi:hypothetical protein